MTTTDQGSRKRSSATVDPATTNHPATSAIRVRSRPANAALIVAAGSSRFGPLTATATVAPAAAPPASWAEGIGPAVVAPWPLAGRAVAAAADVADAAATEVLGGRYAPGRGAPAVPLPGPPYGRATI